MERPLNPASRAIWPGNGGYPTVQWVEQVRVVMEEDHVQFCRPVITFLAAPAIRLVELRKF